MENKTVEQLKKEIRIAEIIDRIKRLNPIEDDNWKTKISPKRIS